MQIASNLLNTALCKLSQLKMGYNLQKAIINLQNRWFAHIFNVKFGIKIFFEISGISWTRLEAGEALYPSINSTVTM